MIHHALTLLSILICLSGSLVHAQTGKLKEDWHHASYRNSKIHGISTDGAYHYLSGHHRTTTPVVVAIIDGDLDTGHEDLRANLWVNPKVDARYPGSVHGWNFLGTSSGQLVTKVGLEAFREYKRLRPKFEGKDRREFSGKKDLAAYDYFVAVKRDAKIQGYLNFIPYIRLTYDAYRLTDSILQKADVPYADLKLKDVAGFQQTDTTLQQYIDAAVRSSWKYADTTRWEDLMYAQEEEFATAMRRVQSLDNTSNPRDSIGDDIHNIKDRYYGNGTLVDSNSFHGTFVAGLVGAERSNHKGIDGVATNARLMGIRAVPDGDEFDKDIALAIRFAVDHGAKIINMSFGKYYATNPGWVTDAIAYALKKNVLIVQAAGNDNRNLDTIVAYPQKPAKIKKKRNSYLLIGASTPSGEKARFSNFGKQKVDFFAPGEKVTSTSTFNTYKVASGTSFSAPIVSGIAALVWGAYPQLRAFEVAEILRRSALKNTVDGLTGLAMVPGVVNAEDALKIAEEYVKK